MSYQEAYYFNKKSKEKALKEMEEKRRRQQYKEVILTPDTSTKIAQDNPTFTKNHHASMYEAMKKVNPRKWR